MTGTASRSKGLRREAKSEGSVRQNSDSTNRNRIEGPREREVLQLVVEGKTSAEIAQIIHISPKNVETYRGNLMKKLGLQNLTELVKFAIRYGLTPLE